MAARRRNTGAKRKRRAGRPAAAESAETRERIVRAAMRSFAISGYGPTRNQEIAAAAGVTSPALYHYFEAKAELYAAAHAHALATVIDAYRAALAGEGGCVARLCALVEASVDLSHAHPGLAEFLALSPLELHRHPELEPRLERPASDVAELYREVLRAGVRAGELRRDLDVEAVVDLLTASSFGVHVFFGPLAQPERHRAVVGALQALLRGTLLAAP